MALHYNFGASLMPLPFKCRFLKVPESFSQEGQLRFTAGKDASQKDVSIKAAVKPTDGQYEAFGEEGPARAPANESVTAAQNSLG